MLAARPPSLLVLVFLLIPLADAGAQSLRGSKPSVNRMYRQALDHDLHFYQSGSGVLKASRSGTFVRLEGSRDYKVAGVSYPYVLPATHTFVSRLGSQYRAACGEKLVVTSAIRPQSFRLANSVSKTVHPTGMAVDLRKPTKARCLSWLRSTLVSLEARGVIEATEERNPPHFHVAVYPRPYQRYVGGGAAKEVRLAKATKTSTGKSAAKASESDATRYKVRRGDSLWAIARRHGTSVEQIRRANEMRSTRIVAGQVLLIPSGR